MKILIVDDEEDVQFMFQQKFRKELKAGRMEFHFAFSGEEALDYLAHKDKADIVLILTDINMPGMSGLELLKEIKQRYPHIKVYTITAYNDDEKYQTAMKYGANDYITKPIDFDVLKEKIYGADEKV